MAIKNWISRFAAGLGIDTVLAGSMETLVNNQDRTRAEQAHALRDATIALQRQSLGAPWFEWNATDLSQFDSETDGSHVNSSTWSVVSLVGLNWIQGVVNTTFGGGANGVTTSSILKMTATPPTADYLVVADFLSTETPTGGAIGAGVVARVSGVSANQGDGYLYRVGAASAGQEMRKFTDAEAFTQLGTVMADPDVTSLNLGGRLWLEVRGSSLVTARSSGGERQHVADTSSPFTAVGQAGLFASTSGAAGTDQATVLFRNVRCFALLD